MTGTTIAQAIPLAITPILTRLYTPEDFGVLALFMAITAVLGGVANGKYEPAIMLPKSNKDALNIVYLSVIIASCFSLVLLLTIVLFKNWIVLRLDEPKIEPWLYFVPIAVFSLGLYNAFLVYNNRLKLYKDISISSISKAGGQSLTQVVFGLFKVGAGGLIIGQIVSYFTGNLVLVRNTFKNNSFKETVDKAVIKKMAGKYKKFPFFSLPSFFINSINLNVIHFLIASIFSVTTLGFYSLTQRMIGIPSRVLGSSIGQVYFQRASEKYNENRITSSIFLQTLKKLLLIGFPIFIVGYFVVEPVFSFVFGEEWRIAGTYAKIIIPLAFIRFMSSTLSVTAIIHNKQQYGLFINMLLLVTTIGMFLYAKTTGLDFEDLLTYLTAILCAEYALFLYVYWKMSQNKL
tara:strand:- start:2491 stop:3702 length:1212 start_codon:yes stop_codon:yes gene_type:complete